MMNGSIIFAPAGSLVPEANTALLELKQSRIDGTAVLTVD